jgi:hypothetical protein
MKYEPLSKYLAGNGAESVALTFGQIETILGASLPPSARRHDAWWSNNTDGHVNAKAWVSVGYATRGLDRGAERVTFQKKRQELRSGRHPLIGSMKGTVLIPDGVDLTEPADPDWGQVYG